MLASRDRVESFVKPQRDLLAAFMAFTQPIFDKPETKLMLYNTSEVYMLHSDAVLAVRLPKAHCSFSMPVLYMCVYNRLCCAGCHQSYKSTNSPNVSLQDISMFLTFALVHTSTAGMPGPAEYPSFGLPEVDVYTLHTRCLHKAIHFWQAPAEFDLFRQHAYGRSAQLFLEFVEGSRVSHPAQLITVAPTPWYSMFGESAECNSW